MAKRSEILERLSHLNRGDLLYLQYRQGEADREEGRGEFSLITHREPRILRVRPFAYVQEAHFGDGSEMPSFSGYIVQVSWAGKDMLGKSAVHGKLQAYDGKLNLKSDTPREVALTICSIIQRPDEVEITTLDGLAELS